MDLDESVNNSSNKSWYQVSKIKVLHNYIYNKIEQNIVSSNLAFWPTSDFDPKRISKNYNIKTLCNYEMSCIYQKNTIYDFVAILNHFVMYLINLCVTETRT